MTTEAVAAAAAAAAPGSPVSYDTKGHQSSICLEEDPNLLVCLAPRCRWHEPSRQRAQVGISKTLRGRKPLRFMGGGKSLPEKGPGQSSGWGGGVESNAMVEPGNLPRGRESLGGLQVLRVQPERP